jgi:hypothetical protein
LHLGEQEIRKSVPSDCRQKCLYLIQVHDLEIEVANAVRCQLGLHNVTYQWSVPQIEGIKHENDRYKVIQPLEPFCPADTGTNILSKCMKLANSLQYIFEVPSE